MESHQQGQTVLIEMERLNEELSAEPVPPHSNRCLKRGIILVSVAGLLAIISTCLLFLFVFKRDCVQMDIPPSSTGTVKIHCRLPETKKNGPYEIFQAQKAGKYLIHGWVRQSTEGEGFVKLVHFYDSNNRTLQEKSSGSLEMLFLPEVILSKNSSIRLESTSQLTDVCICVHEL